jgi:PAS domain S-box-containing protein
MRESKTLKILKSNLADLELYIKQLWNFIPIPLALISPLNVILSISNSFKEFSGYKEIEIVGEDLDKLFVNKDFTKKLLEKIEKEEKIVNEESVFLTKDKKKIPVSIFAMQRKDEDGNFIGYFLSLIDISESKKFQERLKKEIAEKTEELREKINELEKMNKIMVGRELKMIELKEEIERLKKELEKYKEK